jgi:hypothetical protein
MKAYTVFFLLLFGVFATLLALRKDLQASVMRSPGTTFMRQPDGQVVNFFQLKLTNKTFDPMKVEVEMQGLKGSLQLVEEKLEVVGGEHKSTGVIVRMAQSDIKQNSNPFKLVIKSDGEIVNTVKLVFNGPVFD